jgi:hypothetical protein
MGRNKEILKKIFPHLLKGRNREILEKIFPSLLKGGNIEILEKISPYLLKEEEYRDTRDHFSLPYRGEI